MCGKSIFKRCKKVQKTKWFYCMGDLHLLSSQSDINFGWIFPQHSQTCARQPI